MYRVVCGTRRRGENFGRDAINNGVVKDGPPAEGPTRVCPLRFPLNVTVKYGGNFGHYCQMSLNARVRACNTINVVRLGLSPSSSQRHSQFAGRFNELSRSPVHAHNNNNTINVCEHGHVRVSYDVRRKHGDCSNRDTNTSLRGASEPKVLLEITQHGDDKSKVNELLLLARFE